MTLNIIENIEELKKYDQPKIIKIATCSTTKNFYAEKFINEDQENKLSRGSETSTIANSDIYSWNFEIFYFENINKERTLVIMGMTILEDFDALNVLKCSKKILQNWLTKVEENYFSENPYHNSTHAADVLHATTFLLNQPDMEKWFDKIDKVAILLSAIIHDVSHPGRSNTFLINTNNELARLYNHNSILEHHHFNVAFSFTLKNDNCNIFANLNNDEFEYMEDSIAKSVLATDMSTHDEHITDFVSFFEGIKYTQGNLSEESLQFGKGIIQRIISKIADISNISKKRDISLEWTYRITEEFFQQTDEEVSQNLPLSLPDFKRNSCNLPITQSYFIQKFAIGLFEAYNNVFDVTEILSHAHTNLLFWEKLTSFKLKSVEEVRNFCLIKEND